MVVEKSSISIIVRSPWRSTGSLRQLSQDSSMDVDTGRLSQFFMISKAVVIV